MAEKITYTGHFVTDPDRLLAQIPPRITGDGSRTYAHHVTQEFKPENGTEGVTPGKLRLLEAIGEVATEGVHAVLVRSVDGSPISTNEYPHLTIATAEGVAPKESNNAVASAVEAGTVIPIEPPVQFETREGYFARGRVFDGGQQPDGKHMSVVEQVPAAMQSAQQPIPPVDAKAA